MQSTNTHAAAAPVQPAGRRKPQEPSPVRVITRRADIRAALQAAARGEVVHGLVDGRKVTPGMRAAVFATGVHNAALRRVQAAAGTRTAMEATDEGLGRVQSSQIEDKDYAATNAAAVKAMADLYAALDVATVRRRPGEVL